MRQYKLSPFATFVESHLIAGASQSGVFHRLTGQLVEPNPTVRAFLHAAKAGKPVSLDFGQLSQFGQAGVQIRNLIEFELLIAEDQDPLGSLVDFYVNRPLQNPAVSYQDEAGSVWVVSLSMAGRTFSPRHGQLPQVIEESLSELVTRILLSADGTRTLRQIHAAVNSASRSILEDQEFRDAVEFLSRPERQLIKLAPVREGFANPFYPANLVPRNFYHTERWTELESGKSIADFHVEVIEDAGWEFDFIEPTVNHALRFSNSLLSGLDYGAAFCDASLRFAIKDVQMPARRLEVLEVGGGSGTFARSFIQRARARVPSLSYQILDLSPALAESQRRILSEVEPAVAYVSQDATQLDLPGCQFDLIVSNEVIADFPVAAVERTQSGDETSGFTGAGAAYVQKYGLSVEDAPDRFYVNQGVFQFLERAWRHLNPGGVLIVSEYGSESRYPTEAFHLNHSEFSIHFGHVTECARKIGFQCRLETLKAFLGVDDRTPVLNGREEHIRCLNHVFEKYGLSLPFALFSEQDFKARVGELSARIHLDPFRFLPLSGKFHYGPSMDDFLVLIMNKPQM